MDHSCQNAKTSRDGIKVLLFAMFGLPLVINPTISLSFDEIYLWPKLLWLYGAILPAALLILWRNRRNLNSSLSVLLPLSIWVVWAISANQINGAGWLGWWGAPNRADGLLVHLVYILVLLAGLTWARCESNAQQIFGHAVLIGGYLLALTNILQQVGLMGIPGEGAFSGVIATLYGGTLGHRGYMGGALALLMPVAIMAVDRSRAWTWTLGAVVLISWAWAGSFTRGAWLAGALGLLWLALCQRKQLTWRTWAAVALGIVLCVVTTQLSGVGRSFSISGTVAGTGAPAQSLADSSGRDVLWNSAFYGIRNRPLWGWGTPALLKAMNSRPSEELLIENGTRDIENFKKMNRNNEDLPRFLVIHDGGSQEQVFLGGGVNKVHNEYMDYALTYGIPAALLFTALLGWAIWSSRIFLPGFSAGLVAYAAYLVTWPEVIRFAPIAWFMMGLALAGHVVKTSESSAAQLHAKLYSQPRPEAHG